MPSSVPTTSDTVTSLPARDGDGATAAPVDRRAMILNEARLLFLERGYAAISMQQIADAVGINKATLYHHFRDKDDLFVAVLGREMDDASRRITEAISPGDSLQSVLERVALVTLEMWQLDSRSLFSSLKSEVSPARRTAFFQHREFPWSQLRPVFVAAMANGEIGLGDPDVYIEIFLSMARSQAPNPFRQRPTPDPLIIAPYLVSLFIDGVAGGGPMPDGLMTHCVDRHMTD